MINDKFLMYYNKVPVGAKLFLFKAIITFVSWNLLYRLYLQKIGIPNKQLTNITAYCTEKILSVLYLNTSVVYNSFKAIIYINNKKAIGIADPCNALEIYVLYIAFLFCFPAKNRRRYIFSAIGIPLIFILNILRSVALTIININNPKWTDISHHYIFTTLVYLFVFYLWVLFSKDGANIEKE